MTQTSTRETQAQLKYNQGLTFHKLGQLAKAQEQYRQTLAFQPAHHDALHLLGVIAAQSQQYSEAIELMSQAIAIKATAMACTNRGNAFQDWGNYQAAIESYQQALVIDPEYVSAYSNCGKTWQKMKRYQHAIACYDGALSIKPKDADTYLNRGVALHFLNQHQEALDSYNKAAEIEPDTPAIHVYRGISLSNLRRYKEAVESYDKALAMQPDSAEILSNRGNTLQEMKLHKEAIASFDKALLINPNYPLLYGTRLHSKMSICDWHMRKDEIAELGKRIELQQTASPPFAVLALTGSLRLQLKAAETWVKERYPANLELGSIPKLPKDQKIRIGYFSADFHDHATAYLMAELFERHNKDQFELFGFSFGPNRADKMRSRVSRAFDKFLDVRGQSDTEVALLSRSMGIDIAVDLKGFTDGERAGIFSRRAAPIQVNYLGYPGTMGADYIDYLIADKTLIPEDSQQYYAEKIVYLPHSYQVNDSHRKIADKVFTRKELGLPPSGFVFCCFNNNYKITPETFSSWMRILSRVEGSVLWLFEDNPEAAKNLRQEAHKSGVNPQRLIFAERMSLPDHLARHRVADLFIDTLPYNAHTTASDALWAGLPVLTCMGEAFASRVAASLLTAIDLPELITTTRAEYEALAIELATNPERLGNIKQKLERNRLTTPLFDTQLFTKYIERAYAQMYDRYQSGLEPDHIVVPDLQCEVAPISRTLSN